MSPHRHTGIVSKFPKIARLTRPPDRSVWLMPAHTEGMSPATGSVWESPKQSAECPSVTSMRPSDVTGISPAPEYSVGTSILDLLPVAADEHSRAPSAAEDIHRCGWLPAAVPASIWLLCTGRVKISSNLLAARAPHTWTRIVNISTNEPTYPAAPGILFWPSRTS